MFQLLGYQLQDHFVIMISNYFFWTGVPSIVNVELLSSGPYVCLPLYSFIFSMEIGLKRKRKKKGTKGKSYILFRFVKIFMLSFGNCTSNMFDEKKHNLL